MLKQLDKSEFKRENHTVYGNITGQVMKGDYRLVLGYSYETEYENMENFGGIMFMTPTSPRWAHVSYRVIKKMEEDLGITNL